MARVSGMNKFMYNLLNVRILCSFKSDNFVRSNSDASNITYKVYTCTLLYLNVIETNC